MVRSVLQNRPVSGMRMAYAQLYITVTRSSTAQKKTCSVPNFVVVQRVPLHMAIKVVVTEDLSCERLALAQRVPSSARCKYRCTEPGLFILPKHLNFGTRGKGVIHC